MPVTTRPSVLGMSDPIKDHRNRPVSRDHYVHIHRIHEWERLRGLGWAEKDDTEEENMALTLVWFDL